MRTRILCLALACAVALGGCKPRQKRDAATLGVAEEEIILVFVLDLSGSFAGQMGEDGQAYGFVMKALSTYLRDKTGTRDKILFTQISGTKRPLLWEGTTTDLRRDFASATAFRDFLAKKADPGGSRVHDGVRRAVQYVLSRPRVASGKAKPVLLVMSDMDDNATDSPNSEQKLVESLTEYVHAGGLLGMYYVDQDRIDAWRKHFEDAGFEGYCLEGDIVGHPPLPSFD